MMITECDAQEDATDKGGAEWRIRREALSHTGEKNWE